MKIGILTHSIGGGGGGVSTVVCEHATRISNNLECYLYANDKDGMLDSFNFDGVNVRLFETIFSGKYSIFKNALKQIRNDRVDILHQHGIWNYSSIVSMQLSNEQNVPLIISPHGMLEQWILNKNKSIKNLMSTLFQKKGIFKSAAVHALTTNEANDIFKYGFNGRIEVIPNGVKIQNTRVNLLSGDKFRILYLGRIDEKKSVLELIKAVHFLEKEGLEVRLDIYGWGESSYVELMKNEIMNSNSVFYHGPAFGNDKKNAFLNSDVFILPSRSEGLPMAVLESWSYGLPVLMTKACNLYEGFQMNAALETFSDVSSISESIRQVYYANQAELKAMSDNAISLINKKYSWDKVISQLIDLYDEIAR